MATIWSEAPLIKVPLSPIQLTECTRPTCPRKFERGAPVTAFHTYSAACQRNSKTELFTADMTAMIAF